MSKKHLIIFAIVFLISSAAIIVAAYESQRKSAAIIARAQASLSALSNVKQSTPDRGPSSVLVDQNFSQDIGIARAELNRVAAEVNQLKGSVAGQIQNLGPALSSIQHAQNIISNLQESSAKMLEANNLLISQMSDVQNRYDSKISELESNLSQLRASAKPKYGLEFYVGVVGLVTSISSLLLGWRKDSRETEKLKTELAEMRAAERAGEA